MRLSILNDVASMFLLNIQIIQSILPNPNLYLRLWASIQHLPQFEP